MKGLSIIVICLGLVAFAVPARAGLLGTSGACGPSVTCGPPACTPATCTPVGACDAACTATARTRHHRLRETVKATAERLAEVKQNVQARHEKRRVQDRRKSCTADACTPVMNVPACGPAATCAPPARFCN